LALAIPWYSLPPLLSSQEYPKPLVGFQWSWHCL
jgi:hypothetical protein